MIFEQTHYRDYLKGVLAERSRQNPRYSLRALARALGMQPSLLSAVMSGGRKLTEETAMKIAEALHLEGAEREYLRLLVQLDRAKTPGLKEAIQAQIRKARPDGKDQVHDLGVDLFRTIADWFHFALLRLTEVEGFEWSSPAAARALGVSEFDVEQALRRMGRLELIRLDEQGRPRKQTQDLLVSSAVPNEALKKYHAQMLEKAAAALREQSPQERFTGTEDIVLDADQMKEAASIFEECFERVAALSKRRKGLSADVYHLGIHCFKLSNTHESKRGSKS